MLAQVDQTPWRRVARLFLGLVSMAALTWGLWPPPRIQRTLQITDDQLELLMQSGLAANQTAAAFSARALGLHGFTMQLDYPTYVRAHDSELVHLRLLSSPVLRQSAAVQQGTPRIVADARLELPGATVQPADSIGQSVTPDLSPAFVWNLVMQGSTVAHGAAWFSLIVVDPTTHNEQRVLIAAPPVVIRGSDLLGMSGPAVRAFGILGMIGVGLLSLPLLGAPRRRDGRSKS